MTVHILKLCVGIDNVDQLRQSQARRRRERTAEGEPAESRHITRMTPRRQDEVLDGGSLYWVIKGFIRVRQRILRLDELHNTEGRRYCGLILDSELVQTEMQARRPHQGWRYLKPEDTPADLALGFAEEQGEFHGMPDDMRAELKALGLL